MVKSPLFSKFLELIPEQMSDASVLRSVVADKFLWDSKLRKYFLQVVDDTLVVFWRSKVYFKVLRKKAVTNRYVWPPYLNRSQYLPR